MMHGVRGGLLGAAAALAAFLVRALARRHALLTVEIEEPLLFFGLALLAGIYAHGALGEVDSRRALQRAKVASRDPARRSRLLRPAAG